LLNINFYMYKLIIGKLFVGYWRRLEWRRLMWFTVGGTQIVYPIIS